MQEVQDHLKFRVTLKDFFLFWVRPGIYSNYKTRMYRRVSLQFFIPVLRTILTSREST